MTNTLNPTAADVRLLGIGQIDAFSADDDLAVLESSPVPAAKPAPRAKELRGERGKHTVAFKLAHEKVDRLVSWSRRTFGDAGNPVETGIAAAVREYIRRRPHLAAMAGDVNLSDRDVSGRDVLLLLDAARGAKTRPARGEIVLVASLPARDAMQLAKIGDLLMRSISLDSMARVAVEELLKRRANR